MIKSSHRFHGRSSLRFVYQRGQTVRGAHLSLRYVRNTRTETYRAAVVVSRKVSKSAVIRNRIRRRLYEIIRLQGANITEPHDLVFTVYGEEVAHMSHATLKKIVTDQLNTAGVVLSTVVPETDHAIVESKETKNNG
jgi:ribonuclease P protein component